MGAHVTTDFSVAYNHFTTYDGPEQTLLTVAQCSRWTERIYDRSWAFMPDPYTVLPLPSQLAARVFVKTQVETGFFSSVYKNNDPLWDAERGVSPSIRGE